MSNGLNQELTATQIGIRQRVEGANKFNGTLPDTDVSFQSDENVAEFGAMISSDDGGLFSPYDLFQIDEAVATVGITPYIIGVYLNFNTNVEWSLFTTNGRRNGNNQKLDDPDRDVEEATGYGSEYVSFQRQFLPLQCLRVTSQDVQDVGEVNVILMSSVTEYGRA